MTATDELRRMLDERGVEWKAPASYDGSTKYDTIVDGYWFHEYDGKITVHGLTPAQAIAATLGRGECKIHDCEGSFSAVNRPVWRCDCGAFMTQYTDATTYHKPRYCPNCGRRIVDPTTNDVDAEVAE